MDGSDLSELRGRIAQTRDQLGETLGELHGRLNPTVFKEQALEQVHELTAAVRAELKVQFADAKEA